MFDVIPVIHMLHGHLKGVEVERYLGLRQPSLGQTFSDSLAVIIGVYPCPERVGNIVYIHILAGDRVLKPAAFLKPFGAFSGINLPWPVVLVKTDYLVVIVSKELFHGRD